MKNPRGRMRQEYCRWGGLAKLAGSGPAPKIQRCGTGRRPTAGRRPARFAEAYCQANPPHSFPYCFTTGFLSPVTDLGVPEFALPVFTLLFATGLAAGALVAGVFAAGVTTAFAAGVA